MAMNDLKKDIEKINEFINSDERTIELIYYGNDPYYLNYFCKLLGYSLYNKFSKMLLVAQHYLISSRLKLILYKILKVKIGKNVYFGPSAKLDPYFPNLVEIGDNVIIGVDTKIATHEISANRLKLGKVKIGNDAIIGPYSIIKCGIEIANNVEISMGSVVYRDVPEGSIAIGNPARIVRLNKHGK